MTFRRVTPIGSGEVLLSTATNHAGAGTAQELLLPPLDVAPVVHWLSEALHTQVQASVEGLRARLRFARERLRDGYAARDFGSLMTLIATDLESFTSMIERLGDTRAQQLIHTHNQLLRACLRHHHGREVAHTGDGMIAAFRSARDAMRCAIAMQRSLGLHNDRHPHTPLRARIGLHAGKPLREEDRLFGTCVNVTVRVCSVTSPCDIMASEAVLKQVDSDEFCVRDRGSFALKGIASPLRLHELDWHQTPHRTLN